MIDNDWRPLAFNCWSELGVWGKANRARPPSKIKALVVHHSVTPPTGYSLAEVRKVEEVIRNRGKFGMVAYNWIVASDGTVCEGRGLNYGNGANSSKRKYGNWNTLSVCLVGKFHEPRHELENLDLQLDGCRRLVRWLNRDAFAANPIVTIVGHRDVSATACPGDRLYNRLAEIKYHGELHHQVVSVKDAKPQAPPAPKRVLNVAPRLIGVTIDQVKAVQRSVGVAADGIIGPKTWAAIRDNLS